MGQQCSALVKYYQMFQLSATVHNLCHQPKSLLINHFDQWPSAGCLINHHSDVASTQLINIWHRILMNPLL